MNVYVGGAKDYSAMQGPAPSGFHVPLITEWQGLKTIMDGLGLTTGDGWRINLHMPFAGRRLYSNANLERQDSYGYYWSSSHYVSSDYPYYASLIRLDSSNVNANLYDFRTMALSVRCFKDSFEAPTSSWTVVTGTLGSAGIFRNQTDGIISITSNGTTGYTIQDKNLGATTVYNNGDTLTQANMGNLYQWGNNYGFPSTGSVTTSSTQVNASAYGPGNYYSSGTFITRRSSPYGWDSSNNSNLRGGETGESPAELKNAYIGEVYEYSYDFSNKTQAAITADGWTFWGTSNFSSNSDGISGNPIRVGYDISQYVPTANKITMSFVCSLYNSAAAGLRLIKAINDTTGATGLFVTTGSSNYRVPVIYGTSGTNVTPYSNGVYTNTVELDFVNKTYVSKSTGLSDINLTLTGTQISNIRNNIGAIYAYVDYANGTGHLKSVSITIE